MKIPIKYRNHYENQLCESVSFQLPNELWPGSVIEHEYFRIDVMGWATIKGSYSWDGASGPTIDRPAGQIIVPSLVHDMLCQLEREGYFGDVPEARLHADKLLYQLLRERGMNIIRAKIWYWGVRLGSKMEGGPKEILETE